MIKNYFYFIVGILCILSAVTHTMNGLNSILLILDGSTLDDSTKTVFTYIWHIIGVENLILGAALIIMSFHKNLEKVRFTAWLIVAILFLRWIVISIFTLSGNESSFTDILTDTIAIFVFIVLLIFGIRVKPKMTI